MKIISILLGLIITGCASKSVQSVTVIEDGRKIETLSASYEPLKEIGNVHAITEDQRLIRGANPTGQAAALKKNGITDILIFRKAKKEELDAEYSDLIQSGFSSEQIKHIEMPWKDTTDQVVECKKVVSALEHLNDTLKIPDRKIYFHCTMGEDRTGLLAGLFRIHNQQWTTENAYQKEMCKYGFGEANLKKPAFVLDAIDKNLKPLFAQLAYHLENHKKLSPDLCSQKVLNKKRYNQILQLRCMK